MTGDGTGTGPPVTHPRVLVSRDTAPPQRKPQFFLSCSGGLVRHAADFLSWWKEVPLSCFMVGADGLGPPKQLHPLVQTRSIWFLQTGNLGTSESPKHSWIWGWMENVRGRERIPEKWRRCSVRSKETPPSKFLGGPNTSNVIGALSGLLSEPGGEPEERRTAKFFCSVVILCRVKRCSTLEPRTFWDTTTQVRWFLSCCGRLSFYGIPPFIRLFYDGFFLTSALLKQERTNNHHTQRVMYKYIYLYIFIHNFICSVNSVAEQYLRQNNNWWRYWRTAGRAGMTFPAAAGGANQSQMRSWEIWSSFLGLREQAGGSRGQPAAP